MQEPSESIPFFREYGTLILAIYGVAQVWLIALWKRYMNRGKISIFKTGVVEVSRGSFGPTIAITGTLRAERKAVFVREIAVVVTRTSDSSTHRFEWAAFRSLQVNTGTQAPFPVELPSSIQVRIEQPHRYHIFFSDQETRDEITEPLRKLRAEWTKYLQEQQPAIQELLARSQTHEQAAQHLYDTEFRDVSQESSNVFDVLERKNYWEPGLYQMKIMVEAVSPDVTYIDECKFTLDEDSAKELRTNSVATIREVCTGESNYNFAYARYQ